MSEHQPVITIGITNFNREKYLALAIQSALDQETTVPYEVLLVDDGSTDRSVEIARMFEDPRLRIVEKPHTNAPDTRNRCIAEMRGEWLLWLDSDDLLLPDAVTHLWEVVQRYPAVDVIYGDLVTTDADLKETGIIHYESWRGHNEELLKTMLTKNAIPNPGTMISKRMFEQHGGYDLNFSRGHDYEFWSRLAGDANFEHTPHVTYAWRLHEGSMTPPSQAGDKSRRISETLVVRSMLERYPMQRLFPELQWSNPDKALRRAWELASWLPMISCNEEAVAWCYSKIQELPTITSSKAALRILHVGWGYYSKDLNKSGLVVYNHRLAQAQRAQGNEVACFVAGDLRNSATNEPFVTQRQIEEVRYYIVGNRPVVYNDFSFPEREIHNPPIATLFRQTIDNWRPDVVHFHNLVGLGMSLPAVAKAAGVKTVMTVHNFWLPCPRGNLIRADFTRCDGPGDGLQCAACVGAIPQAAPRFQHRLMVAQKTVGEQIDKFLAVSQRVIDLYRQFGFERNQYDVAIASDSATQLWETQGELRTRSAFRIPLRFAYFGTIQPIKGLDVLLRAILKLQELRRTERNSGDETAKPTFLNEKIATKPTKIELSIFGLITDQEYGKIVNRMIPQIDPEFVSVHVHGEYQPDEVGALLAKVDVVISPSTCEDCAPQGVMEALGAGVPVIGSRIGGIPGLMNGTMGGWLFDAGDAEGLAKIIAELIDNPREVEFKRRVLLPPKPFAEHVEELDRCYRELLGYNFEEMKPVTIPLMGQHRELPQELSRKTIFVYSWDSPENACAKLRIWDPMQRTKRWDMVNAHKILNNRHSEFILDPKPSMVIVQRQFPIVVSRAGEQLRNRLTDWHREGVPFTYDIDDDFFTLSANNPNFVFYQRFPQAFFQTIPWYVKMTTSTEVLAERMKRFGVPIEVLPNQLDETLWHLEASDPIPEHDEDSPIVIGWMGTPTHEEDLNPILPILENVLRDYAGRIILQFHGWCPPGWRKREGIRFVEGLNPHYADFVRRFREHPPEIALAPLSPMAFNLSKSDIKFLEYAAVGAVGLYADLPPYSGTVKHRENGYLLPTNDFTQWDAALRELIEDRAQRRELAANAYRYVKAERTLATQAIRWENIYRSVESMIAKPISDTERIAI